jgi:hypothetical protein
MTHNTAHKATATQTHSHLAPAVGVTCLCDTGVLHLPPLKN